jgi:alkaline phosphatase D
VLTLLADVEGEGRVRLEVAADPHFRHVVAQRDIATHAGRNWSVKAHVTGLRPHTRYWYRFETRRSHSAVGRLQTALPADSRQPVHFAAFSCADFTHGFYNAYDVMADEDLDFVVCLGDYIYDEDYDTVAAGTAVRDDRIGAYNPRQPTVVREAQTLADYRTKYALYRTDSALRRMHERFPMIATWDDHEVQNNYAGGAENGGRPRGQLYSPARRDGAYRAWLEAMPTFARQGSRIYRALTFGRALELIVLDERQYRAKQACGDRIEPACAGWDRPRQLLGAAQDRWLRRRLAASEATWKVIGTPTMSMPILRARETFTRFDGWQGYPRQREGLLAAIDGRVTGAVFVAGDSHAFYAGDVRRQMGAGASVATEFVTGSITSSCPGEGHVDYGNGLVLDGNDAAPATPQAILDGVRGLNPWIRRLDLDHHGYLRIAASRSSLEVTMRRMATIKRRDRRTLPSRGYEWVLSPHDTARPSPV